MREVLLYRLETETNRSRATPSGRRSSLRVTQRSKSRKKSDALQPQTMANRRKNRNVPFADTSTKRNDESWSERENEAKRSNRITPNHTKVIFYLFQPCPELHIRIIYCRSLPFSPSLVRRALFVCVRPWILFMLCHFISLITIYNLICV